MTRYARLVSEVFPIVTENYPIVLAILDLIIILVMSHFTLLMEHLIYNFINGLWSLCLDPCLLSWLKADSGSDINST